MDFNSMVGRVTLKTKVDFAEILSAELSSLLYSAPRDLVFLCSGSEEVCVSLQVLSFLSPVVHQLLGPLIAPHSSAARAMRKDPVYISLGFVDGRLLKKIISGLHEQTVMKLTKAEVEEVGGIVQMFGMPGNLFSTKSEQVHVKKEGNSDLKVSKRKRNCDEDLPAKKSKSSLDFSKVNEVNESGKPQAQNIVNRVGVEDYVTEPKNDEAANKINKIKNTMGNVSISPMGMGISASMGPVSSMGPAMGSSMGPTSRISFNPAFRGSSPTISRKAVTPNFPPGLTMTSLKTGAAVNTDSNAIQKSANLQDLLPGISVVSVKEDVKPPIKEQDTEKCEVDESDVTEPKNSEITQAKTAEYIETSKEILQTNDEILKVNDEIMQSNDEIMQANGGEIENTEEYQKAIVEGEEMVDAQAEENDGKALPEIEVNRSFEESMPEATDEKKDASGGLKCPMADCKSSLSFSLRSEILQHLSYVHYATELLNGYPFSKGNPCPICETKGSTSKKNHLIHIGVKHDVVLDLIPEELKSVLQALPKGRGGRGRKFKGDDFSTKTEHSVVESMEVESREQSLPYQEEETQFEKSATEDAFSCHLCVERKFAKVDDLLFHLSVIHFSKDLLEIVPYSEESSCTICEEQGSTSDLPDITSMSTHLTHVGVGHRKVMNFLPIRTANHLRNLDMETEITFKSNDSAHTDVEVDPSVAASYNGYRPTEDEISSDLVNGDFLTNYSLPPIDTVSETERYTDGQMTESADGNHYASNPSGHERDEEIPNHVNYSNANTINSTIENGLAEEPKELPGPPAQLNYAPAGTSVEDGKIEEEVGESKVTAGVRCCLCPPNKTREYIKRSDLLKHLSLSHFGKQILAAFPHDGASCALCLESGGKSWSTPKREVHVCHIGVLHAKVFDFLSEELVDVVKNLPAVKRGRPGQAGETASKPKQHKVVSSTGDTGAAGAEVADYRLDTLNELPHAVNNGARLESPVF